MNIYKSYYTFWNRNKITLKKSRKKRISLIIWIILNSWLKKKINLWQILPKDFVFYFLKFDRKRKTEATGRNRLISLRPRIARTSRVQGWTGVVHPAYTPNNSLIFILSRPQESKERWAPRSNSSDKNLFPFRGAFASTRWWIHSKSLTREHRCTTTRAQSGSVIKLSPL